MHLVALSKGLSRRRRKTKELKLNRVLIDDARSSLVLVVDRLHRGADRKKKYIYGKQVKTRSDAEDLNAICYQ